MPLVNLTPHAIHVQIADDLTCVIPASSTVARVDTTTEAGVVVYTSPAYMFTSQFISVGDDGLVPVSKVSFNDVEVLPLPAYNTIYIVSAMVAQQVQVRHRADVVAPDTGASAVRKDGHVVAVRGFVRYQ